MPQIKIQYLHTYTDNRGKLRTYFNKRGCKKVALPSPDDPAFFKAYSDALSGATKVKKTAPTDGTLSAALRGYLTSKQFQSLRPLTQSTYRNIIKKLEASFGKMPLEKFDAKKINSIRNTKSDAPDTANRYLSIMRIVFEYAVNKDMMDFNPANTLKPLKIKKGGYTPWEEEDISRYLKFWPLGTMQHLALQVLLNTGARRTDAVRLAHEMIYSNRLRYKQSKTGSIVDMPILPDLQKVLDYHSGEVGTFLKTSRGKPFSAKGFGGWFKRACVEAGINGLTAHGLRKAMCTRLANAGCTPHEIMAMSGHLSLKEVLVYTQAAERKTLADKAASKLLKG